MSPILLILTFLTEKQFFSFYSPWIVSSIFLTRRSLKSALQIFFTSMRTVNFLKSVFVANVKFWSPHLLPGWSPILLKRICVERAAESLQRSEGPVGWWKSWHPAISWRRRAGWCTGAWLNRCCACCCFLDDLFHHSSNQLLLKHWWGN